MQQKPTHKYTTFIHFKLGSTFAERESTLNQQISIIQESLRNRGFYPLGFNINTKSDTKASVTFNYQ
jgi:hypothetical protein